jgi:osmotically-inducible protein OsmY
MLDDRVPSSIDVEVEDGVVALNGCADWQYQRDAAKITAARSAGSLEVVDEIEIVWPPRRLVDHA